MFVNLFIISCSSEIIILYYFHCYYSDYECEDNMALHEFNTKKVDNVLTRTACIQLCLDECDFDCLSIDYRESDKRCTLSRESRTTQPSAYIRSNVLFYCHVNARSKYS